MMQKRDISSHDLNRMHIFLNNSQELNTRISWDRNLVYLYITHVTTTTQGKQG